MPSIKSLYDGVECPRFGDSPAATPVTPVPPKGSQQGRKVLVERAKAAGAKVIADKAKRARGKPA